MHSSAIALLGQKPYLWKYLIIPIDVNVLLGAIFYGSCLYWGWQSVQALTRLSFREKLKTVYRYFPASGSFSLLCLGLISVPLLNLFTIPLCIMAATLFICDRFQNASCFSHKGS